MPAAPRPSGRRAWREQRQRQAVVEGFLDAILRAPKTESLFQQWSERLPVERLAQTLKAATDKLTTLEQRPRAARRQRATHDLVEARQQRAEAEKAFDAAMLRAMDVLEPLAEAFLQDLARRPDDPPLPADLRGRRLDPDLVEFALKAQHLRSEPGSRVIKNAQEISVQIGDQQGTWDASDLPRLQPLFAVMRRVRPFGALAPALVGRYLSVAAAKGGWPLPDAEPIAPPRIGQAFTFSVPMHWSTELVRDKLGPPDPRCRCGHLHARRHPTRRHRFTHPMDARRLEVERGARCSRCACAQYRRAVRAAPDLIQFVAEVLAQCEAAEAAAETEVLQRGRPIAHDLPAYRRYGMWYALLTLQRDTPAAARTLEDLAMTFHASRVEHAKQYAKDYPRGH
jgi:hypothetical protein